MVLEISALEGLLESFAVAALGLELKGSIRDLSSLPHCPGVLDQSLSSPNASAAWHTDRGVASLHAVYDETQSQKVRAHVLKIAWRLGAAEHHEGWWHCYPKFPRDWMKGVGRL